MNQILEYLCSQDEEEAIEACTEFLDSKKKSKKISPDDPFIKAIKALYPDRATTRLPYTLYDERKVTEKLSTFIDRFAYFTGIKGLDARKKRELIYRTFEIYVNKFRSSGDWSYIIPSYNFINHKDKGSELARRIVELHKSTQTTKVNYRQTDIITA
jgi:hypothetical protein